MAQGETNRAGARATHVDETLKVGAAEYELDNCLGRKQRPRVSATLCVSGEGGGLA
jgi:hypothetical protein